MMIAIGACIGYLIWFLYKKYIYKKPIVDCKAVAIKDLESLKKIHIVTSADSKDSYFRLSLIIKKYLAARYDIPSLQLTDHEIIAQSHLVMSDELSESLQQILKSMTLIKFERQKAVQEKLEQDIKLVAEFIQTTSQHFQTKES